MAGCLLNYDYIKNHYKMKADFSRQEELNAVP